MKNILVTGGAGYIGSMLCTELIREGYKVTCVDILEFDKNSISHLFHNKNFNFLNLDVTKAKNVKKIVKNQDYIIPLAALVGAPFCANNKKRAVKTNVGAIKTLIKFLDKNQKIIYPTTNSGYGIGQKNKFCDEETPLNPISLYGQTKKDAEKIISDRGNYISFRLATVFGYSYRMRSDLLVNFFVERAIKDKKIKIFEPKFRRNFIHITDIVKALIFSIRNFSKLKNNIYNLGLSNANVTKIELLKKIKKEVKDLKIIINYKDKDPDQRDYFVSNKKIEKKGFKATYSLEEGIKELVQFFLVNNKTIQNNYKLY